MEEAIAPAVLPAAEETKAPDEPAPVVPVAAPVFQNRSP